MMNKLMNRKIVVPALSAALVVCAATSAVAAGGGGHADSGVLLKDFLYRCLNFGLMFGLLAYFVTKPIRKGLAGRRDGIEKALAEAQQARQDAEEKFAEYDRKLTDATAEIEEITATIRREGELEKERTLANAQAMAAKIEADTKKSAAREIEKARVELRREATTTAIAIAEDILKKNFTGEDHARLVDEYMQKVGELH